MHSSPLETSVPLSHLAVFWRCSRLSYALRCGFQRVSCAVAWLGLQSPAGLMALWLLWCCHKSFEDAGAALQQYLTFLVAWRAHCKGKLITLLIALVKVMPGCFVAAWRVAWQPPRPTPGVKWHQRPRSSRLHMSRGSRGDKQRICLERLSDAFLSLTSETRVLTALVFPVHLALSRKNMRETQRKACDQVWKRERRKMRQ